MDRARSVGNEAPARHTVSRWRLFGVGAVILLGLRAAWLIVDYLTEGATQRYHVESAVTLFVIAGLVLRLATARGLATESVRATQVPWWWMALPLAGAALAAYRPSIGVGWLSADFVLLARASDWELGQATPIFFRPLPLGVWTTLVAIGAPEAAWHLLNILLHGLNGYLTARLAERWIPAPWHLFAGAMMVVSPLSVEAVAWASGIFDVSATTFVLSAVIVAHGYGSAPTRGRRALFLATAVLAMLSKETGVVAFLLVLVDAWMRREVRRPLLVDLGFLGVAAAAVSALRLLVAFGVAAPPFSKYLVQRVLFESYGSLSVPWHSAVLAVIPAAAIAMALAVLVLFGVFFVSRDGLPARVATGAALWVLVSVLPVAPMLFVAPDLQGARYLYLAGPAWAALLAGLASGVPRRLRPWLAAMLVVLIGASAVGLRRHLDPWLAAAAARDRILAAAGAHDGMRRCGTVTVVGLPDHIDGAYVFRNGAPEAFARLGLSIAPEASPGCAFTWDTPAGRFR